MRKYKVQVNYKSGISMVFWVKKFDIEIDKNGKRTVTWEASDPRDNAIYIGVDNIESVWEVR